MTRRASLLGALALALASPLLPVGVAAEVAQPAHVRVLPLQGGRNFRDLGGYATANGRQVRWGLLFRSGSMADLTASDYATLNKLGIVAVCDLRRPGERAAEPTVWQGNPQLDYWTSDTLGSSQSAAKFATTGGPQTGAQARDMMLGVYRDFPQTHLEGYRAIFHKLAIGEVPLAFNCSAGKDRSGVAAALILTALGVPRATVVQDYMLSDKVLDAGGMKSSPATAELAKLKPAVFAAVMRSDPAYIEAALDTVNLRYGGIVGYLRVLGLNDADIASMRKRLLE